MNTSTGTDGDSQPFRPTGTANLLARWFLALAAVILATAGLGETIKFTVRATNRDCYALGALAAARFVADKPPGLYSMNDALGL